MVCEERFKKQNRTEEIGFEVLMGGVAAEEIGRENLGSRVETDVNKQREKHRI